MIEVNVELIQERYELAIERIREIAGAGVSEDTTVETGKQFAPYFIEAAGFLVKMNEVYEMAVNGSLFSMPVDEKETLNYSLYEELLGENYAKSYCKNRHFFNSFVHSIVNTLFYIVKHLYQQYL